MHAHVRVDAGPRRACREVHNIMKNIIIGILVFGVLDGVLSAVIPPSLTVPLGIVALIVFVVCAKRERRAKAAAKPPKRGRRKRGRSGYDPGMAMPGYGRRADPGAQERARRRNIDAEISRLRRLADLHGQKEYNCQISGHSSDAAYHRREKEQALAEIRRLQGRW